MAPPRPPEPPRDQGRQSRRRTRLLAGAVLAIGVAAFLGMAAGALSQVAPRRFTASEQAQITNWEYAARWRTLPAGTIFPASVRYQAPEVLGDDPSLTLTASRVGIARQSTCRGAADPTAARYLDEDGCAAMLRATYVDGTGSYVVTVGAAALPGIAQAAAAAKAINAEAKNGLGPSVHTVPLRGTPAAGFSNARRQLSHAVAAGTYVVIYAVGYADGRPRVPVAGDGYTDNEMTSAGAGVARAVLSVLAAPVPAPHCPGAPGC